MSEQRQGSKPTDESRLSATSSLPPEFVAGDESPPVSDPSMSQEAAAVSAAEPRSPSRLPSVDATDSFSMLDYIFYDLSTEVAPVDFGSQVLPDVLFNPGWTAQRLQPGSTGEHDGVVRSQSLLPGAMLRGSSDFLQAGTVAGTVVDRAWDNLDGTQAMYRVPEWLSTKESIWGCYHYLVNSAQAIPNSPLCHGILAWAYAYLSSSQSSSASSVESSRAGHYANASESIHLLSEELCGTSAPSAAAWRTVQRSDQLSLYVSSTFFLCQHDLMRGDFVSFTDRLHKTKIIFRRHWAEGTTPGPIESRIVIWLAFLELRFFYIGGEKFFHLGPEDDFMTMLADANALRVLRGVRSKQSVLSECFGSGLPQEENEEDLWKDRCRLKYDDLLFFLAKVRRFEIWDTRLEARQETGDTMLQELREAKVDALRAELGKLHAECELTFPSPKSWSSCSGAIDTTTFHTLTVSALRFCATVVFSRATKPEVREDQEAQSAVSVIVRIARLLRKAKYFRSPRSTIWPLPLFIAGIETTDEVYQDWILEYMKELHSWGVQLEKCAETLEQVISWQDKTGRRARIRELVC